MPFPSAGDLPNPGIKPRSPTLQADSLPSEPLGKPLPVRMTIIKKRNNSTGKDIEKRERLCTIGGNVNWYNHYRKRGFPGSSEGKESTYNEGDLGSIPGSESSPEEGHVNPTSVFLSGESHEQRSLVGCCPWGGKELDITERLTHYGKQYGGSPQK